ncbi:MAG: AAA family ATPase [Solirubrobacteraceae bacterium]|nr:AAA family ATPase [Solirubrobacteraceae bacterium]
MLDLDLLERDHELAAVDDLLASAAAGEGRFVLIEGPAGIGKSRVLAEVRKRAGSRMRVLSARGGELEGAFPFGVVRQLFEGVIGDPELAAFALDGAAAPARDVLGAPTGNTQAGSASFAVLHGLYWLAQNLADERPLILAVDDLHWVDRPSLRYLAYLMRRLDGAPILLAATLRSSEPGVDPALLAEIAQDPVAEPLRPRPLSREAVTALVRERLGDEGDPEFVEACHRSTGGNPLLLRQLLVALAGDAVQPRADQAQMVRQIAPRAVSRTVLLRLARLSPESAAVARAAAVLGELAAPGALGALAGLEPQAVAEASGALIRAEILSPEPPVGFVHPLVRDAVYQEIPPAERELLHAGAADALRAAGAPAEQVANQLLLAPTRGEPWVVDVAMEAGRSAIGRGAPDGAVAYFQRALDEPPAPEARPGILQELALTEAQTSGPGAAEHLRIVLKETEDPIARAMLVQVLARVMIFTGTVAEARDVVADAMAALPDTPEAVDHRSALQSLRAITAIFGVSDPADLAALEAHRDVPGPDAGVGELVLAAIANYVWALNDGPADVCCDIALSLLREGRLRLADDPLISVAAFYVLQCAERDEVVDLWEQQRAEAHRVGSLLLTSTIHSWYGHTLLRRGDLSQARREFETGLEELTQWGYSKEIMSVSSGYLALLYLEQGENALAENALTEFPLPDKPSLPAFIWLYGRAWLWLAQGDAGQALAATEELERRASGWVTRSVDYPWALPRALALERLGRTDEAIVVAETWVEQARTWGTPGAIGPALRVLGTVQRDAGLDTLQEAVDVLEGSSARLERARALAALGSALRRARRPSDAREPLRRALEIASACDAHGLAENIRVELHAAGARPRTDALAGVESLTPSERRVVDLAAGGSPNREIAQQLYVTPKTVEVHLTNAYRKLGVKSRRDLAGALA